MILKCCRFHLHKCRCVLHVTHTSIQLQQISVVKLYAPLKLTYSRCFSCKETLPVVVRSRFNPIIFRYPFKCLLHSSSSCCNFRVSAGVITRVPLTCLVREHFSNILHFLRSHSCVLISSVFYRIFFSWRVFFLFFWKCYVSLGFIVDTQTTR